VSEDLKQPLEGPKPVSGLSLTPDAPPSPGDGPYQFHCESQSCCAVIGPGLQEEGSSEYDLKSLNFGHVQGVSSMEGRLKAAEEKLKNLQDIARKVLDDLETLQVPMWASFQELDAVLSPGKESRT